MKRILFAAAVSTLVAAPALAQTMDAQEFVTRATSGNLFEIGSSQLALEQSQDEAIQNHAQQMIADHEEVALQLESLAASAGLEVPQEPTGEPAQLLEAVQSADAANIDAVYVENQVAGHIASVELYQTYAENGENSALAAFAEEILPGLQMHLQMAQSLSQM